jgi:arginine decarboxylase
MPNKNLPKQQQSLYVGFFNVGAYQEALSGYGGIKHCLMPSPQHLLLSHDAQHNLVVNRFNQSQQASSMLNFLGY